MDIRKKIGQLFILGFQGSNVTEGCAISRDIADNNLGGVILFDKFIAGNSSKNNIESPEQLRQLCSDLQSLSANRLFVSIDQEGGMVRRLKPKYGFPELPSAEVMGNSRNNTEASRLHAEKTGRMLAELGINLNFAPVADLNVNPQNPIIGKIGRSFSKNPEEVSRHCEIWLESLHKYGVLGCLKHFPGHGSSVYDSHKQFVDITNTWIDEELQPYKTLISLKKVPVVMVGHLFHHHFDMKYPATLSQKLINGILRNQLNFKGLVVTDDMQMRGITDRYGLLESIYLALQAGVDMIVIGNNITYDSEILEKATDFIVHCIDQNRLSKERIEQSYIRIQYAKEKYV